MLNEGLKEYDFNPVTTTADARVVGFPMPGGAIGPNVHMMKEAGHPRPIQRGAGRVPGRREGRRRLDERHARQPAVLAAGVQQRAARPLEEDRTTATARPCSATSAARRCRPTRRSSRSPPSSSSKEPFDGDPLEAAPDSLAPAKAALEERGIADHRREHLPRRRGDRARQEHGAERGHPAPHRQAEDRPPAEEEGGAEAAAAAAAAPAPPPAPAVHRPGRPRPARWWRAARPARFRITIEPPAGAAAAAPRPPAAAAARPRTARRSSRPSRARSSWSRSRSRSATRSPRARSSPRSRR